MWNAFWKRASLIVLDCLKLSSIFDFLRPLGDAKAGNLGFFTVITEKRTMRIYWPQLTDDEGNDESNLMAESAAQASMAGVQEDAVMITTN